MGDLSFEDNVSSTFEPDETNDEVQVDEATKLFVNFANPVYHQKSIDAADILRSIVRQELFMRSKELW